jgi:Mce-associated membrane protein
VTVTFDDAVVETPLTEAVEIRPADWAARAGAFCVDIVFGIGLAACLMLVGWSAPVGGWAWWVCVLAAAAVLLAIMVNRWMAPAVTGWTIGRAVFAIAVLDHDGGRPGPWRLLLRDLAHLLDTLPLLLGWLWPLLDSRGRTFADLLVRTEVVRVDPPASDARRMAGTLATAVALVALLVAGLGYLTVYRNQQATVSTREQIAVEGPKIVTGMLSYTAKNVDSDFARAQALVTGDYRGELTAQQEMIRKAGPVDNTYWVTDGAVLSADSDRATMLLLLQGQRGVEPQQRFITASLRVGFAKSGSGQWQVSELLVLTPPKPESPKPESPKPEAPKPGAAKPESPKPGAAKPATPAPSQAPKPAPPKPGGAPPASSAPKTGEG